MKSGALNAALGLLTAVLSTSAAQAQVVRTFVASYGSDSNACTRTAPCRNFNTAIAAVDAGGEVVALDSAGYGPAVIDKAVTVIAPRAVHAAIAPTTGTAIEVSAGVNDRVTLRGLYLNAQGGYSGISFLSGAGLSLESMVVNGFSGYGFEMFVPGKLFITDGTFRNIGGDAVFLSGSIRATIERTRFEQNAGMGVFAANGVRVSVADSVASANFRGFLAASSDVEMNLERCLSANNAVGILTSGDATVVMRLSNCTITNNTIYGVEQQSPALILSRGNNTIEGNANDTAFGSYTAK